MELKTSRNHVDEEHKAIPYPLMAKVYRIQRK